MNADYRAKRAANGLISLIILFIMLAFALLTFRDNAIDYGALICGAALSVILLLGYGFLIITVKRFDRLLFVVVALLLALGLIMQYRLEPEDAFNQLIMLFAGFVVGYTALAVVRRHEFLKRLTVPLMILALIILIALLFFGEEHGGAKNWISIAGITFQPSEFVKVVLIIVLACFFENNSRFTTLVPALIFAVVCTMLLIIQKDLGAAMLFALTTLIVFFAATGRKLITLAGLGVGCAGAVLSYHMFDHVKYRVAAWRNPWSLYEGSGYQIAQGLMAMASGGLFGLGLGLGSPKVIPAYHTDYIFAVICEEFGVIMGICVIALFIVFIIRGLIIALNAPCRFLMLVALGCTVIITLQSFIIIGGVIKLIPLTGITLPFVSYGGSSIISCMIIFGMLQGIAAISKKEESKTHEAL